MPLGMEPNKTKGHESPRTALGSRLADIYRRLYDTYGPQEWWPGDSPFEVIVGAILTQSAAWTNVERAIENLKGAGALSAPALRGMAYQDLARLVYPSGYYNAKALKLRAIAEHMAAYDDILESLFDKDTTSLRDELLSIHGVGEETADSIILYAAGRPAFVIDAFTRRITGRLGLAPSQETYQAYQALFQGHLPPDAAMFNEYHALLVRLAKDTCRKRQPRCGACPLQPVCPTGSEAACSSSEIAP